MSDSPIKVSVIIPVFNDGKYLDDAIQSVLNQSYHDFEMILADDGSTDPVTLQLLNDIHHPQLRVFLNKHAGVSVTRNFAIKAAKGEYILPLDADDKLGETFLEAAVPILDSRKDVKVVTGDEMLFGKRKGIRRMPEFSLELLMGQNLIPTTSLFRKKDFLQTNGFNENMKASFEDWDFWLSMLENGGDVVRLEEISRHYRVRKHSRNFSLTAEQLKELRRLIYENHKALYSRMFFDPMKSFEYDLIIQSREYRLGKLLLKPVRFLYNKFFL